MSGCQRDKILDIKTFFFAIMEVSVSRHRRNGSSETYVAEATARLCEQRIETFAAFFSISR